RVLKMGHRGTRVVYIPCIHDEMFRDYAGLSFGGVEVQLEAIHNTADGRALLVTHGDAFDGIVLYGSFSRGESDEESDIDLLVFTRLPLQRKVRHQITDTVFEVNLKYDTNFSTLVVDRASWESGIFSILPVRDEILRDGIAL
ncbi:MAG: nucleotidyltransferase domain-containing protein, partial [Bacteroidota bacterium]